MVSIKMSRQTNPEIFKKLITKPFQHQLSMKAITEIAATFSWDLQSKIIRDNTYFLHI